MGWGVGVGGAFFIMGFRALAFCPEILDMWALALHDNATSRARITKNAQLSGPSLDPTSNLTRLSVSCPQINPKLLF